MIVVCGEALVDLVPDDNSAARYTAIPGGSPANAAVALARLGVPTALLARLSGDAFGRRLRAHLEANDVDLSFAVRAAEASSLAIVELDEHGAASYRFDLDGRADWQWVDAEFPARLPAGVVAVHTGSLALALSPGNAAVERFLTRSRPGATICIDPNVRPTITGNADAMRAAVTRWCGIADVVKASADDVAVLYPGEEPESVARAWQAMGPGVAIVTLGDGGVVAAAPAGVMTLPTPTTVVVDTVAAGDTFTAGFLACLHEAGLLGERLALTKDQLGAALQYGLRAAAVTCSRVGADPPHKDNL